MAIRDLITMESRGPIITEADVLGLERKLGHRLPEDYREFLLVFNGGRPSLKQVVFSIGRDTTMLNTFCGINRPISNIEEGSYPHEGFPSELLVIGYDDGGSGICLAIDGEKRGEVWFYDTLDQHEPKLFLEWYERKRDFKKLADSFTDFIKMLQPSPRLAKQREQ